MGSLEHWRSQQTLAPLFFLECNILSLDRHQRKIHSRVLKSMICSRMFPANVHLSSGKWISSTHVTEYYTAVKKKELCLFAPWRTSAGTRSVALNTVDRSFLQTFLSLASGSPRSPDFPPASMVPPCQSGLLDFLRGRLWIYVSAFPGLGPMTPSFLCTKFLGGLIQQHDM